MILSEDTTITWEQARRFAYAMLKLQAEIDMWNRDRSQLPHE